jgi:hypothetical protein
MAPRCLGLERPSGGRSAGLGPSNACSTRPARGDHIEEFFSASSRPQRQKSSDRTAGNATVYSRGRSPLWSGSTTLALRRRRATTGSCFVTDLQTRSGCGRMCGWTRSVPRSWRSAQGTRGFPRLSRWEAWSADSARCSRWWTTSTLGRSLQKPNPGIQGAHLYEMRNDFSHPYERAHDREKLWRYARDRLSWIARRLRRPKFPGGPDLRDE